MLSRRDLLKAAPVAAAAAAIGVGSAPSSLAQGASRVVDMTYVLDDAFPTWFGPPGIKANQKYNFKKDGFNLFNLEVVEHTGTHVDAPLHVSADGQAVERNSRRKPDGPSLRHRYSRKGCLE